MSRRRGASVLAALGACVCLGAAAGATDMDNAFAILLAEHWQASQREQVFFRMDPDAFRPAGKLAEVTAPARARRALYNEQILARLATIDVAELSPAAQVSYQVFRYERLAERASAGQPGHFFAITNRNGWHTYFANAPENMSFRTRADYEAYLASLADFPRYNREHIELLREAVAGGFTQYCQSMAGFEHSIASQIVADPTASVFYAPLQHLPAGIDSRAQQRLRAQAQTLIGDAVIPAYRDLLAYYQREYAPRCRQSPAVSAVPGGADYYDYLVKFFTTTGLTPVEIYALGQAEVKRIRLEMEVVIRGTGFGGSFADFLAFLRTDPQFYTTDPEDLLEKASRIAKRMDGQLPRLFGTLPRNTYDIKPVPASTAAKTTGAYYVPAPGDGITPGTYFVNTSLLDSRPLYTLEALSLHEAVPGHHLQNSIAQELDIPAFRRYLNHSAFAEGWALYAEWLGLEAGFYTDPYSNFGRLTYEMWRACRLVVDTGIHRFGWSRQQAIDFMAENTALSLHEISSEVDRYITWPGQALSYKIGELRIRALRQEAEAVLGASFDLRAFHDMVLGNGSVPIAVMEAVVSRWIEAQRLAGSAPAAPG